MRIVSCFHCRALEKNISRDLRKQKYGHVAVGVSAFITLVDMCHDNLFRFEVSIYNVVRSLLFSSVLVAPVIERNKSECTH